MRDRLGEPTVVEQGTDRRRVLGPAAFGCTDPLDRLQGVGCVGEVAFEALQLNLVDHKRGRIGGAVRREMVGLHGAEPTSARGRWHTRPSPYHRAAMFVAILGPAPAALATNAPVDGDRLSSMLVFFFIALLIVGPFGYRRIRSVLRERRELLGAGAGPTHGGSGADSATIPAASSSDDLAPVIETIHRFAEGLVPGAADIVELPAVPTVGGRVADPAVVVALVEDAARRSGLEISWDDGERRRARVRRPQ